MHDLSYLKSFADFLRYIRSSYASSQYPESYIPLIARVATAYYTCRSYFPELVDRFVAFNGEVAFAISEPEWKNSPANLKSELNPVSDHRFVARVIKGFVLEGRAALCVLKWPSEGGEFALLWLDQSIYQAHQVMLDRPDSSFQISESETCVHYKLDFETELERPEFKLLRKREMILLARSVLYREQIAYAVLAACEAQKKPQLTPKLDLLLSVVDEAYSAEAMTHAKEILADALPSILSHEAAHPFWKWLGRFTGGGI